MIVFRKLVLFLNQIEYWFKIVINIHSKTHLLQRVISLNNKHLHKCLSGDSDFFY